MYRIDDLWHISFRRVNVLFLLPDSLPSAAGKLVSIGRIVITAPDPHAGANDQKSALAAQLDVIHESEKARKAAVAEQPGVAEAGVKLGGQRCGVALFRELRQLPFDPVAHLMFGDCQLRCGSSRVAMIVRQAIVSVFAERRQSRV